MATQTTYPRRASLRTIAQAVIGVLLSVGVVVPAILAIIGEEFAAWLGADVVAAMGTVSLLCVALSGAAARIMAIPAVDEWLTRHLNAGAAPRRAAE